MKGARDIFGSYSAGCYVVQLSEEPSPFVPTERLHCYVGRGARVLHISQALLFKSEAEAQRVGEAFALSAVMNLSGLRVQQSAAIMLLALPTLEDLDAFVRQNDYEQRKQKKRWLDALTIRDQRCPAAGMVVADLPVY